MNNTVLRFPALRRVTGLSRCTIWRMENAGKFPKRIKLSVGTVGWRSEEVQVWIESRLRCESYTQPTLGA